MRMHPAEIANELKELYFFKIFKDRFLLQLCTMIENKQFAAGDCILVEGQNNQNLYFIRSGTLEVYAHGIKVAELSEKGDVVGEMSVITGDVASTTIVAKDDVEVFVIDTKLFSYIKNSEKDFFELLLYKIYCHILVDRLNKANDLIKKDL